MQALPAGGGMAALLGPRGAAEALLRRHPEVEPAAWNSGAAMTVAGPMAALARLEADPAVTGGELALHPCRSSTPSTRGCSSRCWTGWPSRGEPRPCAAAGAGGRQSERAGAAALDAAYWRAHARQPVRFADGAAQAGRPGLRASGGAGGAADPERLRAQCAPAMAALPTPGPRPRAAGACCWPPGRAAPPRRRPRLADPRPTLPAPHHHSATIPLRAAKLLGAGTRRRRAVGIARYRDAGATDRDRHWRMAGPAASTPSARLSSAITASASRIVPAPRTSHAAGGGGRGAAALNDVAFVAPLALPEAGRDVQVLRDEDTPRCSRAATRRLGAPCPRRHRCRRPAGRADRSASGRALP